MVGSQVTLQGNLDPCMLYSTKVNIFLYRYCHDLCLYVSFFSLKKGFTFNAQSIFFVLHKIWNIILFSVQQHVKLIRIDNSCSSLSYEVLWVDISMLLYFRMNWSMLSKIWWPSLVPSATLLIWVMGWSGIPTLRMCGHLWIQFTSTPRKLMPMHSSVSHITTSYCVRGWWKKKVIDLYECWIAV